MAGAGGSGGDNAAGDPGVSGAEPGGEMAGAPGDEGGSGGSTVGEPEPEPEPEPNPDDDSFRIPVIDESALPEPKREAAFIDLEPSTYVAGYEGPESRTSEPARLFYSFVPADEDPKNKPVFVFFNGGPGFSSMSLLMFGTGPQTLRADDLSAPPVPNPSSFTRFGNLLYIDSRDAGFSYGLSAHPERKAERRAAFLPNSFNAAIDGADFVRVLLRVLDRHAALRNNPVVLVGESYGGTRAAVMLELLLAPQRVAAGGKLLVDPRLANEILEHYRAVFPGVPESEYTRPHLATQFGWQVLIEPFVGGELQLIQESTARAAVEQRMLAESGLSRDELYMNCTYHTLQSRSWCDELDAAVIRNSLSSEGFESLVGVNPALVPGLKASDRSGAFRFEDLPDHRLEPQPWLALLGDVPAWDAYFSIYIGARPSGFSSAFGGPYYIEPFLTSLRYVNTMITNAHWDFVVITETIAPMIASLFPESQPDRWITSVRYEGSDDLSTPTERILLNFAALPDPEFGSSALRVIHFPKYSESGHMVTVSEPEKFADDVAAFLRDTGGSP